MKWLTDAVRRAAPLLAREGARVLVTVAVSLGLLGEVCGADLLRVLPLALKPFGS